MNSFKVVLFALLSVSASAAHVNDSGSGSGSILEILKRFNRDDLMISALPHSELRFRDSIALLDGDKAKYLESRNSRETLFSDYKKDFDKETKRSIADVNEYATGAESEEIKFLKSTALKWLNTGAEAWKIRKELLNQLGKNEQITSVPTLDSFLIAPAEQELKSSVAGCASDKTLLECAGRTAKKVLLMHQMYGDKRISDEFTWKGNWKELIPAEVKIVNYPPQFRYASVFKGDGLQKVSKTGSVLEIAFTRIAKAALKITNETERGAVEEDAKLRTELVENLFADRMLHDKKVKLTGEVVDRRAKLFSTFAEALVLGQQYETCNHKNMYEKMVKMFLMKEQLFGVDPAVKNTLEKPKEIYFRGGELLTTVVPAKTATVAVNSGKTGGINTLKAKSF